MWSYYKLKMYWLFKFLMGFISLKVKLCFLLAWLILMLEKLYALGY